MMMTGDEQLYVRAPDRQYRVDSSGVGIAVYEWGDKNAPPLLLAHGGFDFARTYDGFAPRLADGGWRVVAWDQRGHGDSDHAPLGTWDSELRDAWAVRSHIGTEPMPLIGHSKGGGMMMALADVRPDCCSCVVNLDGLPSRRPQPDVADRDRTKMLAKDIEGWLDHRRTVNDFQRKPGTLQELAKRRARMNPRLTSQWLEYLVTVGAREDADGWRWKLDPAMRFGGFGPFRTEWALSRLRGLGVPFLGIMGLELEEMGWGTKPEDLDGWLPDGAELVTLPDVGHFVHVERPDEVAAMVLDFLDRKVRSVPLSEPRTTVMLSHRRVELALHRYTRPDDGATRPMLLLHGLGEASPAACPGWADAWPGPVWALDLTGHGASTVPRGGGYFPEGLMSDVDAALAHLGEVTVVGRGLGAYVGLLIAGARPSLVRGVVLDDGPGLFGGGPEMASGMLVDVGDGKGVAPDPLALMELSSDVRPPDYARDFVRQAVHLSGLDQPITVVAVSTPAWLAAVGSDPSVVHRTMADAIAYYAAI